MKTSEHVPIGSMSKHRFAAPRRVGLVGIAVACLGLVWATAATDTKPEKTLATIPWSQLGTKAGADYRGDGLAVTPNAEGARLRCVFQRLEGEATREGLWLISTATNTVNDRFRIVAADVRRLTSNASIQSAPHVDCYKLASTGTVSIDGETVRFIRPGLIEEYTVSMDGVRQDFLVQEKPGLPLDSQPSTTNSRSGQLCLELAVTGARVEQSAHGIQLKLENSDRKIAYSRLRVTDATGRELNARIEMVSNSALRDPHSELALAVVVDDADAIYPVRIDPTFSDANWISMGGIPGVDFSGIQSRVSAAVVDDWGNLYIGGIFNIVGDVSAANIAKWNGSSWSALGSGMNAPVRALAVLGTDVYVGGEFTTAGGVNVGHGIAKWNGTSWSALGPGLGAPSLGNCVCAIAVSGSDLYAGGNFNVDGNGANIAKWDGTTWSALGSGTDSSVWALAVTGSDLYAGGEFSTAGGGPANYVARWDGSGWWPLGAGVDSSVSALAVMGNALYTGGSFTNAGGSPANYIAKWDGADWSSLGSGVNDYIWALAVIGNALYAGGSFTNAGGSAANYIAKWDGSSWATLGLGVDNVVEALAVSNNSLYAGGWFTTAGGSAGMGIANWNGSGWSAVCSGMGMNGQVYALAASDAALYVAGEFTSAGGIAANSVAKWNGSSWSALGSGMNGDVYALAVSGSDVYAGGAFTTAGGVLATNIAKWNGSSWSALGSGVSSLTLSSEVHALAVSGSDLYVGGLFDSAGGLPADSIAKWDGSSWSALGWGIRGYVFALAVSGTDLYAGGYFFRAGDLPATGIAKWNGSGWSTLGAGVNGDVYALAVSGSDVYVGGSFTMAGGIAAMNIAKWNGSTWSALGSGIGDYAYALAVSGNNVYAANGGNPTNYVARWNGSSWSALGSGLSSFGFSSKVSALALSGSDLYVGGEFWTAGGKASAYLAKAIVNPPILVIGPDGFGGYFINFSGVPGSPYRLQRAPSPAGPWSSSAPQTAPASGLIEFWDLFPPPGQGFYRTVEP